MEGDGSAQRQRAMRGQPQDKPIGQRPNGIVVFLLGHARLPLYRDRGALDRWHALVAAIGAWHCCARFGISLVRRRNECNLLHPAYLTPLHLQATLAINPDEDAGMDDLARIENFRPVPES